MDTNERSDLGNVVQEEAARLLGSALSGERHSISYYLHAMHVDSAHSDFAQASGNKVYSGHAQSFNTDISIVTPYYYYIVVFT